jgi:glycosyltransferase involved in cell wall biosynthesis
MLHLIRRVLVIHNDYARSSGEEHAGQALADLLVSHGHDVSWYRRSSADIAPSLLGKLKAFFTAFHNPAAVRRVQAMVHEFRPDIVQVQNVYPLISPSIFPALRKFGVPVVMRCPNYRLFCPNGLHLSRGEVCERCLHGMREINCLRYNCLDSYPKSLAYALRNWVARKRRCMLDNVDMFVVQSEFQKAKFVTNGIAEEQVAVVPGLLPEMKQEECELGDTVSFVGRISPEKGLDEFLGAARMLPEIPFAVAGDCARLEELRLNGPGNVTWHGFLQGEKLDAFYRRSRILVFPSRWYEGFPNVATHAMARGKPIIASRIGVFPEIVDDGVTGDLFRVRDAADLAAKIGSLYHDAERCRQLGEAGRRKAMTAYSREAIYARLMDVYSRAQKHAGGARA